MTYELSVLLPTRGRTDALKRSLLSLASLAQRPEAIELLLAFDEDDTESATWCRENILPELDAIGIGYSLFEYPRLGYIRLNEYVNSLAQHSEGRWLMFWGDDAVMLTQGWDVKITEVQDFRVLRIPTHNKHPYAIFPILPKAWVDLFGYVSAHQLSDSWVSQIAYMLDIVQNIDVEVVHDRFDITGNNNDDTYKNRPMLEGNHMRPEDFNHISWRKKRFLDAAKIADYLDSQGQDTTWFKRVKHGTQDPWEKMTGPIYDPNKHLAKFNGKEYR